MGTLPISRSAIVQNGGQFEVVNARGDRITLALYQRYWSPYYLQAHPVQIVHRGGCMWTFAYGTSEELLSITDNLGRAMDFDWFYSVTDQGVTNPESIQSITLPDGTELEYAYENFSGTADGSQQYARLKTFRRVAPNAEITDSVTYLYELADRPTALTGVIDHAGVRFATWEYDYAGHATRSVHAGGVDDTQIAYSANGTGSYHYRTVTNALGKATTYTFKRIGSSDYEFRLEGVVGQPSDHCVGTSRTFSYTNNRITTATDEDGYQTRYSYDSEGRIQSVTEACGQPQQRVTQYSWHPTFRVPTSIVGTGLLADYGYDPAGRLTSLTQTDTTTHSIPYPTNGQVRAWIYSYDAQGLLASIDGPLEGAGDVTAFEYSPLGYLRKTTNAAGHVHEVLTFDGAGRPTQVVDPNGVVTDYDYDEQGRLLSRTTGGLTTSFEYGAVGELTQMTLPSGEVRIYDYDDARRLTSIQDGGGNRIVYTLDDMGNRLQEGRYDSSNALLLAHASTCDELGRLLESYGSQELLQSFAYDNRGHVASVSRPTVPATTFSHDALGRLEQIAEAGSAITSLTYNALDQLTQVSDPRSLATQYTYGAFGDPIQQSSPDTGLTTRVFDAAGDPTGATDARGQTAISTYDLLDRVTSVAYADQTIGYNYDTGPNGKGRLTGISDGSGTTAWTYTAQG